jgi:hypothetical protein
LHVSGVNGIFALAVGCAEDSGDDGVAGAGNLAGSSKSGGVGGGGGGSWERVGGKKERIEKMSRRQESSDAPSSRSVYSAHQLRRATASQYFRASARFTYLEVVDRESCLLVLSVAERSRAQQSAAERSRAQQSAAERSRAQQSGA